MRQNSYHCGPQALGRHMALLPILQFPDPRLRTKAQAVERVTHATRAVVDDLLDTMYAAAGIGLSATQVDVHQRIIVIDVSPTQDAPLVLINPRLDALEGSQERDEGCLSVPTFFEPVARAERVRVTALDVDGKPFAKRVSDLLAVCVQHECDHLEGKLFVDYLSSLKRNRIRGRLAKMRRQGAAAG